MNQMTKAMFKTQKKTLRIISLKYIRNGFEMQYFIEVMAY